MDKRVFGLIAFSSVLAMASAANALSSSAFKGEWLGWGCMGEGAPIAISLLIDGDTDIWEGVAFMADKEPFATMNAKGHVDYAQQNGSLVGASTNAGFNLHFAYEDDDGEQRLAGTLVTADGNGSVKLKFSGGPASDLPSFADAYAGFCD